MALITDINTAGASGLVISTGSLAQILISGTWNDGSVSIQKYVPELDSWHPFVTVTDNDMVIIEAVGSARYRTFTTHGGSATSLICQVSFHSSGYGLVEAA